MSGYCPDCGNAMCLCDGFEGEVFASFVYASEYERLKEELARYKSAFEVLKVANKEMLADVVDDDNKNYTGKWFRRSREAAKQVELIMENKNG